LDDKEEEAPLEPDEEALGDVEVSGGSGSVGTEDFVVSDIGSQGGVRGPAVEVGTVFLNHIGVVEPVGSEEVGGDGEDTNVAENAKDGRHLCPLSGLEGVVG